MTERIDREKKPSTQQDSNTEYLDHKACELYQYATKAALDSSRQYSNKQLASDHHTMKIRLVN